MDVCYKKIGLRIRTIRKKLKISQEKLAEYTNLSTTHISHIETGATKASVATLLKLSEALQCTPNDFLCDSIETAKPLFIAEISETLEDCSEYEIRVIADLIHSAKISMRSRQPLLEVLYK